MKTMLAMLIIVFLTGCASNIHQTSTSLDVSPVSGKELEKVKKLEIDQRLFDKCKPLVTMPENPRAIEVLEVHKENALNYSDCTNRHQGLVEIIKKYIGIE